MTKPSLTGRSLTRLIVTADDFGISRQVNEAVEKAHKNGIVTATSLMVAEPFAADAVERARSMPDLGVGLHVSLSRAHAISPIDQVPDLLDRNGLLRSGLVGAGFAFFFLPHVRRQLENEIRAQFEAFAKTGLTLDHVNAHNHLHLHPTVLGLILKIGPDFGMKAIRLPLDKNSRDKNSRDKNSKSLGAIFLAPWLGLMKSRLNQHGIAHNDVLLGLEETGALDTKTLIHMIENLSQQTAELMCHPATGPWAGMDPAAKDFRHDREYMALIDPATIKAIGDNNVCLMAYGDI